MPKWDRDSRRLFLGRRLITAYPRQPAPNQVAILAAFEQWGWHVRRVICPVPAEPGESASQWRRRVYDTVKNLNRRLPRHTILFRVDGETVRWEFCPPVGGKAVRRARR